MSDMDLFVGLSAALTGIDKGQLAPELDPLNVKQAYFDQAASTGLTFPALLEVYSDLSGQNMQPNDIAKAILANGELAPLARAIMLEWYTGSWYPPGTSNPVKVISADAYTQGWMWSVAQAHPMGYSNWHFGYWSSPPPALTDFTTGGQ